METVDMNTAFWKGKSVFLTGHTGFKGTWASLCLAQAGAQVTGYALPPEGVPNLYSETKADELVHSVLCDIRERDRLLKALQESQAEIVIHMAAQPLVRDSYLRPMETFEVNAMGTAYLLEAIRQCPQVRSVVVVTTDKVYENLESARAYEEQDALGGYDPYSASKACAEIVASSMRRSFFRNHGQFSHAAGIATARAGNVIGGGDWSKDRLIPDLIRAFSQGQEAVLRNPHSVRPWQHVLEPVHAYFQLAEKIYESPYLYAQAWNIGPEADDTLTVEQVAQWMAKYWGNPARLKISADASLHEAGLLHLNIEKTKKHLQWKPRWNSHDALTATVEWYKKYLQSPAQARQLCLEQIHSYQAGKE